MTPEGKVKASINKMLKRYPQVYKYMPVPAGFGPSSLDYLLCVNGCFIGVEAKRPGKLPTPRQQECIRKILEAKGSIFIVYDQATLDELERYIGYLYASAD